ncbi:MAG: argininosuccinate lyase [Acidobacteria bacterium]|nr:argininosuccinate lyase [Acidobacteriota bacterium]
MKKIIKAAIFALLVIGFMCLPGIGASEVSAQGRQDFTLVNRTGVEIYAFYVSPHSSNEWGEDILGADTLLSGEELDVFFSPKERAKYWDIRIEDEDGNYIVWDRLNLLEISKVTLYYRNKKPTAVVE